MPLTGPVSEGKKFFCPSCGALYSVTYTQAAKRQSREESGKERSVAKCVVCLKVMSETDSASVPVYTLIHRPEDA
jgi:transcription elongation factor Elf1